MTHWKALASILIIWSEIENVLSEKREFKFQQKDYEIQFERLEAGNYSERYFKQLKVFTFKYNRTAPVANATFQLKVALGNSLEVIVQAYKFLSNEYRLFPLHFEVNFCDALKNNLIGIAEIFKCGNFTGCPLQKDIVYHFCNWAINKEQFPPLIPDGKYMIDLSGYYYGEFVGKLLLFGTAYRPIGIP